MLIVRSAVQKCNRNLQSAFVRTVVSMKSDKLLGKVAVVTASTAGIGFEIAKSLANNGAKVVVSSRKEHHVTDTVNNLRLEDLEVSGVVCHVGKDGDRKKLIQTAIDAYGQLDILVSNAGISPYFGPLLNTPESAWDKIFELNLKAGFLLAKEAMPHLTTTKGSILFVSSITGYNPFPLIGAYSISKTALLGLVKALAIECAPQNVRVNGIAPGIIDTDFSSALTQPGVSEEILKTVPMNRFGHPSECAGPAVFLSSDDASYITGEILTMSGGMHTRL